MPLGDWSWMTRSILPMSMPSSSDDVATSARMRPAFRSVSIASRASRDMLPWYARTRGSSGEVCSGGPSISRAQSVRIGTAERLNVGTDALTMRSLSFAATRSARRRLLTNTSVERCARINARTSSRISGQMPSDGSSEKSSAAHTTRKSISFLWPALMMFTGRGTGSVVEPGEQPPRYAAILSSGRCVAERPIRTNSCVASS